MAMKVITKMWVDPPEGHLYGFPKVYTPEKDGDINRWLTHNGYPKEKLPDEGVYIRWWPCEDTV